MDGQPPPANASTVALMRAARERSLLLKWSRGGRLTSEERSEIEHLLPSLAASPPKEGVEVVSSPPPQLLGRVSYKKKLREYVTVFDTRERQIKRWIKTGKEAVDPVTRLPKPDLPPLDEPASMLEWWERHMSQRPQAKIVALAAGAPPASAAEEKSAPVNVDELNVDSLDSLKQAKRYLAAVDHKLGDAYRSGDEAQIRRWQKPFNDALESVRKAEASARDAAKARDEVVPKAELFSELSQLLEVLRQMRSTMGRRIKSRLADLAPELLERIGASIDLEREREDSVLRQLKRFRSIEEIHLELEPT